MNYAETTLYLFSQLPQFEKDGAKGYKEGLQNSLALDAHFGHPHRSFRTIHVAGTNGKGSPPRILLTSVNVSASTATPSARTMSWGL